MATFLCDIHDDIQQLGLKFFLDQQGGPTVWEGKEADRRLTGLHAISRIEFWTEWNNARIDPFREHFFAINRRQVINGAGAGAITDNIIPTVLVVDDEADIRLLYEEELHDAGYVVITAADGYEGLKRFEQYHPDLVVLDIKMPHMDGIELLRRLREISRTVPIVINTGFGEFLNDFRTWASDAYITKSPNLFELKNKIRELLGDTIIGLRELKVQAELLMSERRRLLGEIQALEHSRDKLLSSGEGKSSYPTELAAFSVRSLLHDIRNTLLTAERALGKARHGDPTVESAMVSLVKARALHGNIRSAILGEEPPGRGACRVSTVFDDVIKVVRANVRSQIVIEGDVDPGSHAAVRADDLFRVIFNLAENAREAFERERILEGAIRLVSRPFPEESLGRRHLEIAVEDSGPGFPPELITRVFRSGVSVKRAEGGGLGLPIAKRLVDNWGGRIQLDTSYTKGCRIAFTVPATEEEEEE